MTRDNGLDRVSRLLTLLALYQHGCQVGKYISIERITEQSKETYYESLNKSSQKWHQAKHDVFPWFNYFLGTILGAYIVFRQLQKEKKIRCLVKGKSAKWRKT